MKIALPLTESDAFSAHYGASAKFVVFDVDRASRTIRRRTVVVPQESEPCQWPQLLRAAGVELLLTGGMGWGARQRMAEHGVEVLLGVPAVSPEAVLEAWMEGRLEAGRNACDGNGPHHHDRGAEAHGAGCCG